MDSRRQFLKVVGAAALSGCASSTPALRPRADARAAGSSPKRILVLGGTGFIGPAIVDAGRARGHALTLFNRGKSNPQLFPDVETILGDRSTDLPRLRGRQWDAVIDTWTRYPSAVRAATELLADQIGQYVFVSTVSVYKLGRLPLDEDSPHLTSDGPLPEDQDLKHYGPLKSLCEKTAHELMPGRVTVVRPGVIAGPLDPTDRFTYWPARMARGGEMLVPDGPAGYRMQFIDVRDLAEFIITTIEARHFGTYNAVGPDDPSLRAVLSACRSGTRSDVRMELVDKAWLDQNDVGGWPDLPLVVAGDSEISGFARVSAARAIAKGLRFRSPAVTAKDTLAWWSAQPESRRNQPRPGLTPEREAELLKRWHARAAKASGT